MAQPIGDQGVTVQAPAGFDARRAALCVQFKAEEWFGDDKMVTNLGIAAALVAFYGCKHAAKTRFGESIDMYAMQTAMRFSAAARLLTC